MSEIVDPIIERVRQDLKCDGCSIHAISSALNTTRFSIDVSLSPSHDPLSFLRRWRGESFVADLGNLWVFAQTLTPERRGELREMIRMRLNEDLFSKPWSLDRGGVFNHFMRYRSILPEVVDLRVFRDCIVTLMKTNIEKKTMGPLGEFSHFAALHYKEIFELFPDDEELRSLIIPTMNSHHRWVALYSFTSPEDAGEDIRHSLEFPCEDDVVCLPNVHASKRADRRFTDCRPQAEAGHADTSLNPQLSSGRNTYVFSGGKLLGSLKHGEDDLSVQSTFLAMRTVATDPSNLRTSKYPLITGGLYLVSDQSQLFRIMNAHTSIHLEEDISFMPLRPIDGMFGCNAQKYVERIRALRKQLEM